jgi:hypothetical protein
MNGGEKALYKLGTFCVFLLLVIAALAIAVNASSQAADAAQRARAYCDVSKKIAEAPIPSKVDDFGLEISAGFRKAYYNAGCTLGPLKPADPRVARLLPPGIK